MPKVEMTFQSQVDESNWQYDLARFGYAIVRQTPHGLEHIPYSKYIKDLCNE